MAMPDSGGLPGQSNRRPIWTVRRVENVCAWGDTVQMVGATVHMVTGGPPLGHDAIEVMAVVDCPLCRGEGCWDCSDGKVIAP